MRFVLLLQLLLFFSLSLSAQYEETISDYFASSDDYALRQLSNDLDERSDTLMGRALDSLFALNIPAFYDLSSQVVKAQPDNALGYLFRSVARADLDSMPFAYNDVNRAIELAPDLMLGYSTKARFLQYDERDKEARAVLELAGQRLPDHPEPVFLLGAMDWKGGHTIRARKRWEESVTRDSCYVPARTAILIQRYQAGRLGKGITELEQLLNCEDVSPDVYHLLALAEINRGRGDDKALEYVNAALDLSPGEPKYLKTRCKLLEEAGEYEAAVEDLYDVYASREKSRRRHLTRRLETSWNDRMEAALSYYILNKSSCTKTYRPLLAKLLLDVRTTDYAEIRKTTKDVASSSQAEIPLAKYLIALGTMEYEDDDERKLEAIAAALQADPAIADLYRLRGAHYFREEDYRAAYADYAKLLALRPNTVAPLHGLAKILDATDRARAAGNMYSKILTVDSTDLQALKRLGDLAFAGQDYAGAEAYYTRYLKYTEDQATVRHNRATCRYVLGDLAGAGEDLRGLSEFYAEHNLEARNLHGVILSAQDSTEAALGVFNAILYKDADYTNAYLNRGRLYAGAGEWEKCIADLDRVVTAEPDNVFAVYERGIARHELGVTGACEDIRRAEELGYGVTDEVKGKVCGP